MSLDELDTDRRKRCRARRRNGHICLGWASAESGAGVPVCATHARLGFAAAVDEEADVSTAVLHNAKLALEKAHAQKWVFSTDEARAHDVLKDATPNFLRVLVTEIERKFGPVEFFRPKKHRRTAV